MRRPAKRWGEEPHFTQGVFGAAFLIGVAGIIGLKMAGANQWWVTSLPLALMATYAALVFIPPIRLRPDQTGDNLYYLGFLFTLVSLGYSLHQFSVDDGVDEIVQNFGIAIASTIGGVFGRVLLNQMRTDPWELERTARLALVDSARALRNELDGSVIEFNAYRREIQQAAADGIRELQTIVTTQLEGSTTRLESMVETTAVRVEKVVADWTTSAGGFNQKSSDMAVAMESLSRRLDAVRAPAEIIEEKIAPAGEAVMKLAGAAEGAARNIEAAIGRIETGAAELKGIVEGSREIVDLARSQSTVLSEASAVLVAARRQVEQMEAAAERFESHLGETTRELSSGLLKFVERLEGQLAAARAVALEGQSAVADGVAKDVAKMAVQIDQLARAATGGPPDPVVTSPSGGLVMGRFGDPGR